MEWQPIETYDTLPNKERPERAVFYFERMPPTRPGNPNWPGIMRMERSVGVRNCTYWMPLPAPPKE